MLLLDEGRVGRLLAIEHLQVAFDDGERGAQLVRRVGDELLLSGEGRLQPVEHGVHGECQLADLVLGAGVADPSREILVGDGRRRPRDPADRVERSAEQEPRPQSHHEATEGASDSEQEQKAAQCVADARERAGDLDRAHLLSVEHDARADHPIRLSVEGDIDQVGLARTRAGRGSPAGPRAGSSPELETTVPSAVCSEKT